jgi:membrane associated rhomboid family serine protease
MHDPYTLYGGLIHLFGNMLFLYVFGDNVEDVFGHAGYIFFYFVSGLLASSAYIMSIYIGLSSPADLTVGVIGASGAISGVLGAYLVLYPKARILTLVFAIWILLIPVPAIIFLGFWFLMQWFYGFFDISGGVAYWAHIGGFMAGMILALIFGLERKRAQEARFRL